MTHLDQIVTAKKADYEACFGCGSDNPIGIGIGRFHRIDGGFGATFSPLAGHRGFEGLLHGGIIATALDEMLAWTATLEEDVFVFTGKLELRYPRRAPADAAYRLRGFLDERRGRRLLLHGDCRTEDGEVVAEASGLYLVAEVEAGTLAPTK
jgi:acyl-coenzyme A thioesterase PaaI-like protein